MKYDYIIVGSGSAGSIVAARLSDNGRHSVLLLEAGGSDRKFLLQMPLGYGTAFYDSRVNWMYNSAPVAGLGGRSVYVPRGKVVGGSGSINAMVYMRGGPADFEGWKQMGNPGWGWVEVLEAYRAMEDHVHGPSSVHGAGGPLAVMDCAEVAHPLVTNWFAAAEEAGLNFNTDLNGASIEGTGYLQFTIREGKRQSSARAWLWPALKRRNLKLETGAHATRIRFAGKRATAVEYRKGSRGFVAEAGREVILAAGSINSAQLLQLSGVGPADLLKRHGIEVIHEAPAVGRNLQDHLCYDHVYKANVATCNRALNSWPRRIAAGLRYVLTDQGPLAMSTSHAGGFVRSREDLEHPNLQLYFSPYSFTREAPRRPRMVSPDPFDGFLMSVSNCRPVSRGHVEIATADPLAAPLIQPNFLANRLDVDELLEGAHLLRRLAAAGAMAAVIAAELKPGPDVASDDDLIADIRARGYSIYHPAGTCRMGPDPTDAVVDHRLKAHGLEGLRIVDASIFPTLTSGNINAPAMMVGERGAGFILEDAAQ